jgi:dienelactone hydrolase
VLSFDFRGHGQSDGHLDPPSAARDLRTALAYLRSYPAVDAQRIGLVGASMGGIASVIVGAGNPSVCAVITISTSPEAAGQNAGQVVHQLSPRPYLAIGCDRDPLTRQERVQQLFEAAGPPKEITILKCAAHANDILGTAVGPQLMGLLVMWLDIHVKTCE